MRLKSIKIAGFKSFVDPTNVIFPSNLCAVVGPNGCGKSNVIDAVRWVMGETSAKNLRGDLMSDVIFNGSSARKPVGQATVELIFDNSLGRISGEYASYNEIGVKRKVTRDGQSSYFLNGSKCRRRDITDIFLGTGLGARGYGIIEQGMISQLIEAKPDELRGHVEEAAGISKYKERRKDTENRISRTTENLERLTDIRDELGRQLARLERQARAAEKYSEIKKEKRQIESELLGLKWRAHDVELVSLKNKITDLEILKESLLAERLKIETTIEKNRIDLSEEGESFNQKQAHFYQVGNEVARIEQSIENAKQRSEDLERELKQTEESFTDTRENLIQDKEKSEALEQELNKILPKIAEYKSDQTSLLKTTEDLANEYGLAQSSWDAFLKKSEDVRQEAYAETSKIKYLDKSLSLNKEREKKLSFELSELRNKESSLDVSMLKKMLDESERDNLCMQEQLKNNKSDITALRDGIKKESELLHTLKASRETILGKKSSLEILQQKDSDNNIKDQWLNKNGIDSNARLINSLDVEPGWEVAVETVLGDYLQANESKDIGKLLDDIESFDQGELIVFDTTIAADHRAFNKKPSLSEFVNNKFAKSKLSNVYVVDSLEEGKGFRSQLGIEDSLITKSGVWIGKNWLKVLRISDAFDSMISREKQIKDLSLNLEKLDRDILEKTNHLENSQLSLSSLESEAQKISDQFASGSSTYAELKSQYTAETLEIEQILNRKKLVVDEIAQLNDLINQDSLQMQNSKDNLHTLEKMVIVDSEDREKAHKIRNSLKVSLDENRVLLSQKQDVLRDFMLRESTLKAQTESTKINISRAESQLQILQNKKQDLLTVSNQKKSPSEVFDKALTEQLKIKLVAEERLKECQTKIELINFEINGLEKKRSLTEVDVQQNQEKLEVERLSEKQIITLQQTLEEQIKDKGYDLKNLMEEIEDNAEINVWEQKVDSLERKIQRLGPINLAAVDEYNSESERKTYLDKQNSELEEALAVLQNAIRKIDSETRTKFKETFDLLNTNLQALFPKLFGGGHAYLDMVGEDLLNTGVLLMARPPGKKNASIHLLSGGEKALTAIALVFAIFKLNPAPFCMLDEVDAPLDDSNVARYASLVKEMADEIQFIYITHNKISMKEAHQLMGVTMHEPGVSRLVSVDVNKAVEMASA